MMMAVLCFETAQAQVVMDGSLGPSGSLVGPDFRVTADLGQQRGANLFHSFSQFNIGTGESATFSGSAAIANIISRVTGGDVSTIDGLLRSDISGANLFLLNPAGVLFGSNASLDVSGSLHISSADYLRFANNEQFMAVPQVGEVLSTAAPAAFGFLGSDGAIQIQGAVLTPASESTLTLAANGIDLDNASLVIDQGAVQLASVASVGEVSLATGEVTGAQVLADINIINQSEIRVGGEGGGRVFMQGDSILMDESVVAGQTTGDVQGQGIVVQAMVLDLSNDSVIDASSFCAGGGGNIDLQIAQDLTLYSASTVSSDAVGTGNAGSIVVLANQLLIDDAGSGFLTGIFSDSTATATGDAGTIDIQVENVDVLGGGFISSSTFGVGDAGDITVSADRLLIDRAGSDSLTGIFSDTDAGATGDAGTVNIQAVNVEVLGGGQISSSTFSAGDAGSITVSADLLLVDRAGSVFFTGIFSDTDVTSMGDAGSIDIQAGEIEVLGGGEIGSNTFGAGDAGSIAVLAERLSIDRVGADFLTGIFSDTDVMSTGDAGSIDIQAGEIEVFGGGEISSSTFGAGGASRISVLADQLLMDGTSSGFVTGILTRAGPTSSGNAGSLMIDTRTATLGNRAVVSSATTGTGRAGNVVVSVVLDLSLSDQATISTETVDGFDPLLPTSIQLTAQNLSLDGGSSINTNANGTADAGAIDLNVVDTIRMFDDSRLSTESVQGGGQITVQVNELLHLKNSEVTTSVAQGGGNGGDIFVDPEFILLDNSSVIAQAFAGAGGNITLIADYVIRSAGSVIDASSRLGIDGQVDIQALGNEVDTGEEDLSADFLKAAGWIKQACTQRSGNNVSSFIINRRHPRPSPYDDWSASPVGF
ncbi:hypothetical protein AB835_03780 [Candidatus Endobugula sertula]|uniref:Filamentous haemagglutinin FhaB/tRNA nuclease CdiA-like TPS domain-containing protein n=1 Tax=Candidatus Endobugula sertula TaxID=62101 RepID=A0A1D2QS54_9GAMM|nr:hypothetical protein AB835_03780 [Candidatus Endobugula sertula]